LLQKGCRKKLPKGKSDFFPHLDPVRWPTVVARFNSDHGKRAARLAREIVQRDYRSLPGDIQKPVSLGDIQEKCQIFRMLASPEWMRRFRVRRVLKAACQGAGLGFSLFLVVDVLPMTHSGELQLQFFRMLGR
jgi:hypothetical protein